MIELQHIYFHRDFDGIVSAAILLRQQREAFGKKAASKISMTSVNYHLKEGWTEYPLAENAAVVDFLFHPNAVFWADHHFDPFVTPQWKEHYSSSSLNKTHWLWNPNKKSCPPLLLSSKILNFQQDIISHFSDYASWSNTIDSAGYANAKEAMDLSNPYILLSHILAKSSETEVLNIIEKISSKQIASVITSPFLSGHAEDVLNTQQTTLNMIRNTLSVKGGIAFFDQSEVVGGFLRYAPYQIRNDVDYTVGIYRTKHTYIVSVGHDPWGGNSTVHLGNLCRPFGGGGHQNVAGITAQSHFEARLIAKKLQVQIRGHLLEGHQKKEAPEKGGQQQVAYT